MSPGTDWSAWREALSALPETQLTEVIAGLEKGAAYVPAPAAGRAAAALAVVELMKLDTSTFERVATDLTRLRALPGPLLLERWLRLQRERHRAVPVVGGRGEQYRLPIEDIYVPLSLADRPTREQSGGQSRPLERGRVSVEEAFTELERRRRRSLLWGISVVGKPGAGKTTLLSSLVAQSTPQPWGVGSAALGLPADLWPVYLRFSSLWPRVVASSPASLDELVGAAADALVPGSGSSLLARGRRLLLLLDGLDEVPNEAARVAVCRWLVGQAPVWREEARLVVSCRLAAWERAGDELQSVLLPLSVQGFDRPARERYVHAWFSLVCVDYRGLAVAEADAEVQARQQATALLDAIASADAGAAWRLEAMARVPLLLSVMCLVHLHRGQLPRTRRQLYEECLSILLETWHRHQGRARPVPVEPALSALSPLAWRMQSARAAGEQDAKALGEAEVLVALAPRARPDLELGLDAESFLRWLGENGVLESPAVGQWSFSHLTFQEYLAARHAIEQNLEAELAVHLDEPWWRETLLLASAQPGFYARLLEAAWQREPSDVGRDLLRSARDEYNGEVSTPHLRVIRAAAQALAAPPPVPDGWWPRLLTALGLRSPRVPPDPGPPIWRVRLALELAPVAAREVIAAAARPLVHHPDPHVAREAAALIAGPVPSRADQPPVSGEIRMFRAGGLSVEAVWVPPGRFWMGSGAEREQGYDPDAYDYERPRHRVTIPHGFWLGRFPITNGQYAAFLRAQGGREPWSMLSGGFDAPEQPVLEVDWREAVSFCSWWTAQSGALAADLPTEAEWEWAARGQDGRRYPWGGEAPNASLAHYGAARSAPVGAHPAGRGPFGAEEQAGDAWEWCRSIYRPYSSGERVDNCQDDAITGDSPRVLRGGSWSSSARDLRVANRLRNHPRYQSRNVGFRIVFRTHQ